MNLYDIDVAPGYFDLTTLCHSAPLVSRGAPTECAYFTLGGEEVWNTKGAKYAKGAKGAPSLSCSKFPRPELAADLMKAHQICTGLPAGWQKCAWHVVYFR